MDRSGYGISEFADILILTHQGLKKNISHIQQTWLRLDKLHQTGTAYVDSTTLTFLLPFSSKINSCICKTLQDRHGHINWKLCLASTALLVRGPSCKKLGFIQKLYDEESLNSLQCILKDVLRSAQRIAISLNVEVPELSRGRENIGSAKYHGEAALDLMIGNLLSNCSEQKSISELRKPFSISWNSVVSSHNQTEVPCSRSKHSACISGHSLYVLGGRDGRHILNDVWQLNLVTQTWTQLKATGDAPPSLEEHTMVSHGHKIFVFGGVSRMSVDGETPLWLFDTSNCVWTHWESDSEVMLPPCLKGHSAVLVERNMYIFGGYEDILGSSELMWSFDILDEQWHLAYSLSTRGSGPSPRHYHSATLHNNSMLVVGGVNSLNPVTDMWSWCFSSCSWTKIKALSNHPIIYGHTAVKLANSLFVFGGHNQSGLSNAVWEYKMESTIWKRTNTKVGSAALCRSHHITLLISPSIYSEVSPTERTHSMPLMHSSTTSDRTKRPRTTSPAGGRTNQPSYIFHNKVGPVSCQRSTQQCHSSRRTKARLQSVSGADKTKRFTTLTASKSDYTVEGSYFRSDSNEPLIEQSRTWSDGSLTFDNPAYLGSYGELSAAVSLGSSAPPLPPSYRKSSNYGQLSRSLDSIQDMVHDGSCDVVASQLPGSVMSYSDETINEARTVRNINLDECSQAWTANCIDDMPVLPDEEVSIPTQNLVQGMHYKLLIIGGQEKSKKIYPIAQQLVIWSGEINTEDISTGGSERCVVS